MKSIEAHHASDIHKVREEGNHAADGLRNQLQDARDQTSQLQGTVNELRYTIVKMQVSGGQLSVEVVMTSAVKCVTSTMPYMLGLACKDNL